MILTATKTLRKSKSTDFLNKSVDKNSEVAELCLTVMYSGANDVDAS